MFSQLQYNYPQGGQRDYSHGDYTNQEAQEGEGGCDMTMSYSTESYLSTSGLSTSSTNTLESLPNTPSFQDSGSSTEFGGSDYGTPLQQDFELSVSSKIHATTEHRHRQPKHTPSTLGWTLQTQILGLYKFVVGKGERQTYFELIEGAQPTNMTPLRVYLDRPRNPQRGIFPCMYPGGCKGKKQSSFSRPADLERHYRNVHAKLEQKDLFPCDYPKCVRSEKGAQVPFTRKDHYRDHLRDFHKEDLGAVKCEKKKPKPREEWEAEQRQWLGERVIYPHYWRCTKCLDRIIVVENGWECSRCKATCEIERSDARKRLEESTAWPAAAPIYCFTCGGRGNGYGEKVDCNECNGSYETRRYDLPSHERPALVPKEEHFDVFVGVDLPCATCAGMGYVEDEYGIWVFCSQCRPRSEGFYNTGPWP